MKARITSRSLALQRGFRKKTARSFHCAGLHKIKSCRYSLYSLYRWQLLVMFSTLCLIRIEIIDHMLAISQKGWLSQEIGPISRRSSSGLIQGLSSIVINDTRYGSEHTRSASMVYQPSPWEYEPLAEKDVRSAKGGGWEKLIADNNAKSPST